MTLSCPLCDAQVSADIPVIIQDRRYHHCTQCDLVFLDPQDRLSPEDERQRYTHHENHLRTPGYERFLNQLLDPVMELVAQTRPLRALDFGSGPYPMLADLAAERGLDLELYDPFFHPRPDIFEAKDQEIYNLITCTEVVEHFSFPIRSFEVLNSLLIPGGTLALMTEVRTPDTNLSTWPYARDETHTSLYSQKSLEYIANHFFWSLTPVGPRVFFLKKQDS